MENIPAFRPEKFMTAKSNFLSAIYFELSDIVHANGVKEKYSEEWADVDQKLKENEYFGGKIRKAKKMMADIARPLVEVENDPLAKAYRVYDYFIKWFQWNGEEQKYSVEDVKRIYESQKGNSADINLLLVGALQSIGLNADPVLVSTRNHGTPFKSHPQRSDFNYVVAGLRIGDKLYLLDATDPYLPFGILPIRCLNDQGRLVSMDESQWVDLKPVQKQKSSISMVIKLEPSGVMVGELTIQYAGYSAVEERKNIHNAVSLEEYYDGWRKKLRELDVSAFELQNKNDITKALVPRCK